MTPMLTRARKEARLLAVPAALILAVTALSLTWLPGSIVSSVVPGGAAGLAVVSFYLGLALLSALPFGAEFQQRTLVMLLSQPVSRERLWLEKWTVLATVILGLAALQYAALEAGPFAGRAVGRELMFLVVMLCSTGFWTLVAGSTIGGVAFSLAALLLLATAANTVIARLSGVVVDLFEPHPFVIGLGLVYAALAGWFGWRMLARFEVASEGAGTARVVTAASSGMLRCRARGALRNLARKELRLQHPTFLIAATFTGCWLAAIALLAASPARPETADVVFTIMLAVYLPLALVVAGTVSVCEDTTLGVLAWHLTVPVSSRAQWLVKLGITAAVAATLVVVVPVALAMLAPAVVTLPGRTVQLPSPAALAPATIALVLAFWASTLFGHTTRAAVATGVAVATLGFCAAAGGSAGLRSGPGSDVLTWIMVRYQLTPEVLYPGPGAMRRATIAVFSIVALTALHQSLAAFRRVNVDRRTIVVYSLRLAAVSFAGALVVAAYTYAAANLWRSVPVRELLTALEARTSGDQQPRIIPVAELEAAGGLSPATRTWLAGSQISITPRVIGWRPALDPSASRRVIYLVRVILPNGRVYQTDYWREAPPP